MLNVFRNIITISIILLLNIPCYAAVATPSNFDPEDVVYEYSYDYEEEEELNAENLEIFYSELFDGSSASDRDVAGYIKDLFLTALHEVLGEAPEDEEEEEIEISIAVDREEVDFNDRRNVLNANRRSVTNYKNVVVFSGSFNNYDCDLVFPYAALSALDVIDGKLVNVSNTSVTGRILYDGEVLDPSEYDSYIYIVQPIYGSTTNVYNYGSFNYRRHYYLQSYQGGQRIATEDMYGNFLVDTYKVYYSSTERNYYVLLIMMLMFGVGFLWIRRH